jgi:hypothetical protein
MSPCCSKHHTIHHSIIGADQVVLKLMVADRPKIRLGFIHIEMWRNPGCV